ncbi:GDSL-type esterase/lipase family protein [Leadbettera azotonutricia]|nr:GDSL-type esterase/lipase family protein [Leadbettera azotonutricia]
MAKNVGYKYIPIPENSQKKVLTRPIVCLGDSLTEGYVSSMVGIVDREHSYPAFLQEKVNVQVVNSGISGNTTKETLDRIEKDVLAYNPDMVIVFLGTNDFFLRDLPLEETQENLQKILDKINDGDRLIFLVKFYSNQILERFMSWKEWSVRRWQSTINKYDSMFEELAHKNNAVLISGVWEGIDIEADMPDSVHPDTHGYWLIEENIFLAVKSYISEENLIE